MEVSLLSGVVVKIADLEFEAARAKVGKALRVHPQAVKILHQNEVISELPADPDANLLGLVDQCRHAMEVKWRDLQGGAQELMRRAKVCQDIRKKLKAENLLHSRGDLDHAIRRQESEASFAEGAVLMGVSTLAQEKKEAPGPLSQKC
ncbi:unnamed protein product [Effrenium voratum]|nr:unnamed protein product [Effrenium voratum]